MSRSADPQSYDGLADHYERLTELNGDPVAAALHRWLPARGTAALDVGCGAGRHTVLLAEHFDRVSAIDISQPMIGLAETRRGRPNVEYRRTDLEKLTGSYNLVFSSAVLHHVPRLDAALRCLRGLVAPGGRAILIDVIGPSRLYYRVALAVAPRLVYRAGALLRLGSSLVDRDRSGIERYRLATFRPWLDHLATDRFLTRLEFDETYGAVFSGSAFEDLGYLRACIWDSC